MTSTASRRRSRRSRAARRGSSTPARRSSSARRCAARTGGPRPASPCAKGSTARRCGAVRLAERAAAELRATGARPRSEVLTGPAALTASERRTAEMAAAGLSNAEIAQALFVTVKTVEGHLSGAYRKLDVRSRAELPEALTAKSRVAVKGLPGRERGARRGRIAGWTPWCVEAVALLWGGDEGRLDALVDGGYRDHAAGAAGHRAGGVPGRAAAGCGARSRTSSSRRTSWSRRASTSRCACASRGCTSGASRASSRAGARSSGRRSTCGGCATGGWSSTGPAATTSPHAPVKSRVAVKGRPSGERCIGASTIDGHAPSPARPRSRARAAGRGGGRLHPLPRLALPHRRAAVRGRRGGLRRRRRVDVAVANEGTDSVTVLLRQANGTYAQEAGSPFPAGDGPISVVAEDFSGDARPDLALANFGGGTVTVLRRQAAGGFAPEAGSPIDVGAQASSVASGTSTSTGAPTSPSPTRTRARSRSSCAPRPAASRRRASRSRPAPTRTRSWWRSWTPTSGPTWR